MAVRTWNSSDGDWDAAGSWTGGLPGGSDAALLNSTKANQAVTTDVTGIATLDELIVHPGYLAAIGGSGNEVTCSVNTVRYFGGGELWLKDAAGTTDDVLIRAATPSGIVNLGGATMSRVYLERGTVTIAADMGAVALLSVGHVDTRATDVNLTITSGAGTVTDYQQSGGIVSSPNILTRAEVTGGTLRQTGTAAITTLAVGPGGVVNYESTGTITLFVVQPGGFLDLGEQALTVTRGIVHRGGVLKYDTGLVTFTNPLLNWDEALT